MDGGGEGGVLRPPDDWHHQRLAKVYEPGTLEHLRSLGVKTAFPRDEFQDRR